MLANDQVNNWITEIQISKDGFLDLKVTTKMTGTESVLLLM